MKTIVVFIGNQVIHLIWEKQTGLSRDESKGSGTNYATAMFPFLSQPDDFGNQNFPERDT